MRKKLSLLLLVLLMFLLGNWQKFMANYLRILLVKDSSTGVVKDELLKDLTYLGDYRFVGRMYFYVGEYVLSSEYLSFSLEAEDNLVDRYLLGQSYYERGNIQLALEKWKLASPRLVARVLTSRAIQKNLSNDPESAIEYAELALKLDSGYGESYLELGRAQAKLEKWNAAMTNYEKAAQLITDHYTRGQLYRSMGSIYKDLGELDSAIDVFEKAVRITPNAYYGHLQLADAYSRKGWFDAAVSQAETAISLQPANALAYLRIGDFYRDRNRLVEALSWYEHAKFVDPDSGRADYAIGSLLLSNDEIHKAIPHLERAIELNWSPYWVWFSLGNAYEEIDKFEKAVECYMEVVRLDDVEETVLLRAWIQLAQVYSDIGLIGKSEQAWAHVFDLDPQHPSLPESSRDE